MLLNVDWSSYEKFLEAVGARRIRLTYDQGTLEIMTVSGTHEWWKRRLGFVLALLGKELRMHVQGYASTTVRRRDVGRGLEPDEFFYIRHASQMHGPREFDFAKDPPPDLGIEIDISVSSLNRMGVYAALGIPEVWRFDGEALHVYRLRPEGDYVPCEQSLSFPSLPLGPFIEFLKATQDLDDAWVIDPFQEWARTHALPASQDPPKSP